MLDEYAPVPRQEAAPIDAYGDVALGVECAWPEVLPAALPVLEPQQHPDA